MTILTRPQTTLSFDKLKENRHLIVAIFASSIFCMFSSKIDLNFFSPYYFSDLGHQLYNYKM
ncbi:MAG: hypothetical protein JSV16_00730, partial [Candidatus Hydrogenedentota bacterium]